jgi:cobalamin biosynthesis protein CobD/CbiB
MSVNIHTEHQSVKALRHRERTSWRGAFLVVCTLAILIFLCLLLLRLSTLHLVLALLCCSGLLLVVLRHGDFEM